MGAGRQVMLGAAVGADGAREPWVRLGIAEPRYTRLVRVKLGCNTTYLAVSMASGTIWAVGY